MTWIARLKSKQASCCCEVMTKSMLFVREDAPDHCLLIVSPLVYTKTKQNKTNYKYCIFI